MSQRQILLITTVPSWRSLKFIFIYTLYYLYLMYMHLCHFHVSVLCSTSNLTVRNGGIKQWRLTCTMICQEAVVGKMTTFDLWPFDLGGGAWGARTNMWYPETPASYESLPAPLATQITTLYIHKYGGRGQAGALILDRCRAFNLFARVDAHLCLEGQYYVGCPLL